MSAADALDLAAAGLPCFPCSPADKRPLTSRGFYDATTDLALVRCWWRCWPDALPATPTGEPSGLWVADLDLNRETGEATGESSFLALGLPWPEHRCRTRSGGWHLPFRWREGLPRNTAGRLPGVDSRGQGGFIIAWNAAALIAATLDPGLRFPPDALLSALARPRRPTTYTAFIAPRNCSRWAAAALSGEVRAVVGAPEGARNHTLNRSAFRLGQLVATGDLGLKHVTAALMQAATAAGLPVPEAAKTIASGLGAGAQFPRQNTVNTPRPTNAANPRGQTTWTRGR